MLKIDNVHLTIGSKEIIHGISVEATRGEFIVIIGQNGAGKSSLLELIAGTRKPTEGSITLAGHKVASLTLKHRAQLITRLYQQPARGSIGSMTVRENCALALYKNKKVSLAQGLAYLHETDLCNRIIELFDRSILDRPMASLSGGQRQLLAFIMATADSNAQLLLLDEPTAALDFKTTEKMLTHIEQVSAQSNMITILITHDFDIVTFLGRRLWVIKDGKLTHDITYGRDQKLNYGEFKKLM